MPGVALLIGGPIYMLAITRDDITVLLALLGVEVVAAVACALLVARACERPGQRLTAL